MQLIDIIIEILILNVAVGYPVNVDQESASDEFHNRNFKIFIFHIITESKIKETFKNQNPFLINSLSIIS